ncbi:hypothetical protein [Erythrobacter sp. SD-21]|uniref:hypothetical protein n=1 Tax=Erythrobacter sp. SD-21 TaxID=161528 RepID=UPI0018DE3DB1|nr:hypothetical protein [Erythrobacter sp. SD-21]
MGPTKTFSPFAAFLLMQEESPTASEFLQAPTTRLAQLARELPTFSNWNTCDPSLLEGLLSELRHYDNISYLPLVASFAIPFFAATNAISVEGIALNVGVSILGLILSLACSQCTGVLPAPPLLLVVLRDTTRCFAATRICRRLKTS